MTSDGKRETSDEMRIGIGYDIHCLNGDKPLIVGGVKIPFDKGIKAHSDGDVLIHAVCDAVLGALGETDLGTRYPDNDPKYKNISSKFFLKDMRKLLAKKKKRVENIDCVVITEEPKIAPYRDKIRTALGDSLGIEKGRINVKGKTAESVGEIGKGKAIAAYVVALVKESESQSIRGAV